MDIGPEFASRLRKLVDSISEAAVEQFIVIFAEALSAIREPRLFETERGYQAELHAELRQRLSEASFPGDPMIEQ